MREGTTYVYYVYYCQFIACYWDSWTATSGPSDDDTIHRQSVIGQLPIAGWRSPRSRDVGLWNFFGDGDSFLSLVLQCFAPASFAAPFAVEVAESLPQPISPSAVAKLLWESQFDLFLLLSHQLACLGFEKQLDAPSSSQHVFVLQVAAKAADSRGAASSLAAWSKKRTHWHVVLDPTNSKQNVKRCILETQNKWSQKTWWLKVPSGWSGCCCIICCCGCMLNPIWAIWGIPLGHLTKTTASCRQECKKPHGLPRSLLYSNRLGPSWTHNRLPTSLSVRWIAQIL